MEYWPPRPDWIEISKIVLAAPFALDEADALLNRYDAGELPLEALEDALRALAVSHKVKTNREPSVAK